MELIRNDSVITNTAPEPAGVGAEHDVRSRREERISQLQRLDRRPRGHIAHRQVIRHELHLRLEQREPIDSSVVRVPKQEEALLARAWVDPLGLLLPSAEDAEISLRESIEPFLSLCADPDRQGNGVNCPGFSGRAHLVRVGTP